MAAFCNSIALVSILLTFSSSPYSAIGSTLSSNILLRELMPALSDDKASDNAGFENKMLKDKVEIKAGESLESIGEDFGRDSKRKLNPDMTESV